MASIVSRLRSLSRRLIGVCKPSRTDPVHQRSENLHTLAAQSPRAARAAALFVLPAFTRSVSSSFASSSAWDNQDYLVSLNNISDNPGATKQAKRLGRGIGSGLGKTSGRGHKGQKARTGRNPKLGFEGGQTPLRKRAPRRGFHNPHSIWWDPVNLGDLQLAVDQRKLNPNELITMKAMRDAGLASKKVDFGVKLLARGAERFSVPVNIQVSQASAAAREAIEKAGGTVTTVYYNKLGIRALLKPEAFAKKRRLLPRPARPPPKLALRFDSVGCLPPDGLSFAPAQILAGAQA